jgi:hypothetical protein
MSALRPTGTNLGIPLPGLAQTRTAPEPTQPVREEKRPERKEKKDDHKAAPSEQTAPAPEPAAPEQPCFNTMMRIVLQIASLVGAVFCFLLSTQWPILLVPACLLTAAMILTGCYNTCGQVAPANPPPNPNPNPLDGRAQPTGGQAGVHAQSRARPPGESKEGGAAGGDAAQHAHRHFSSRVEGAPGLGGGRGLQVPGFARQDSGALGAGGRGAGGMSTSGPSSSLVIPGHRPPTDTSVTAPSGRVVVAGMGRQEQAPPAPQQRSLAEAAPSGPSTQGPPSSGLVIAGQGHQRSQTAPAFGPGGRVVIPGQR